MSDHFVVIVDGFSCFSWLLQKKKKEKYTINMNRARALDQGSPNFYGRGPHWWFLKTRRAKHTKEFNLPKKYGEWL